MLFSNLQPTRVDSPVCVANQDHSYTCQEPHCEVTKTDVGALLEATVY